jgi:hypothetical protein
MAAPRGGHPAAARLRGEKSLFVRWMAGSSPAMTKVELPPPSPSATPPPQAGEERSSSDLRVGCTSVVRQNAPDQVGISAEFSNAKHDGNGNAVVIWGADNRYGVPGLPRRRWPNPRPIPVIPMCRPTDTFLAIGTHGFGCDDASRASVSVDAVDDQFRRNSRRVRQAHLRVDRSRSRRCCCNGREQNG